MHFSAIRPRLTDFEQLSALVLYLREEGLEAAQITPRIMQIGPVDLDMLNEVLQLA